MANTVIALYRPKPDCAAALHDLDEAEVKPYFQLDQMIDFSV